MNSPIYLGKGAFTDLEIDQLVTWLNDRRLMRYSEQRHVIHTREGQLAYIRSRECLWAIRYRDGGELIGTMTAYIDHANRVADLGILVGVQGHGYGSAAWIRAMAILKKSGLRKVEAGCMSHNDGMMRICEKAEMQIEGWRTSHFVTAEGTSHMVLWGKLL